MTNLRNELPTQKQLDYIEIINDFADNVPPFKGTTKREASLYIAKYGKYANMSSWTIQRGY